MTASGMETPDIDRLAGLTRHLFQGARTVPPDGFKDWALEQVRALIPFDSGLWGSGSILNGELTVHSVFLLNQPMHMMENYERYKEQDILNAAVWREPGKTIDILSVISREELVELDIYRHHVRKYGMEHAMGTAIRFPDTHLFSFISFFRSDYARPFSETERRSKEIMTPALVDARNLNTFLHLNELGGFGTSASAICDIKGMLREAESGFPELMQREWPEWRGPLLPVVPESVMDGGGEAVFHGNHVVMRLEPWNELVRLTIREKGAFDSLTPGERQVAGHLTEGLTNKEIAKALGISPKTVGNHLHHIFAKLDVPNRQRAIAMLRGEI